MYHRGYTLTVAPAAFGGIPMVLKLILIPNLLTKDLKQWRGQMVPELFGYILNGQLHRQYQSTDDH